MILKGLKKILSHFSGYSSDGKAALFTLGFAYVYLVAEIVYKFKVLKQNFVWEIVLIFLLFAIFGFFKKLFGGNKMPVAFDGTALPHDSDKASKKARNRYYCFSSCLYAAVFATVTFISLLTSSQIHNVNISLDILFNKEMSNVLAAFIASAVLFVFIFIFAYMIDYIWYEYKASAYKVALKEEELRKKALAEIEAKKAEEKPKRKPRAKKEETATTAAKKTTASKPKKPTQAKDDTPKAEAVATAPKRRGRPPKVKPE